MLPLTAEQFDGDLERRLDLIKSVLASKAAEYSAESDRMHNFNRGAEIMRTTPERALAGMMLKHIVSVLDLVDSAGGGEPATMHRIEEKIGDTINYLILLESMLKHRRRCALRD